MWQRDQPSRIPRFLRHARAFPSVDSPIQRQCGTQTRGASDPTDQRDRHRGESSNCIERLPRLSRPRPSFLRGPSSVHGQKRQLPRTMAVSSRVYPSLTFLSNIPPANTTVVSQRSSLVVENRVTIRFTRNGRKKLPFYRIVAIDSRKRRDGAPLEYLGWYDPMKKEANLNAPAIRKWLAVGALPSETVSGLLKKAMVIEN